jgi:hypothetical protein
MNAAPALNLNIVVANPDEAEQVIRQIKAEDIKVNLITDMYSRVERPAGWARFSRIQGL